MGEDDNSPKSGTQSEFKMKDSGSRESFESGAMREDASGKGAYELISPILIARLARVLEDGTYKYEERNWEKGMPVDRCMQSALRHLYQYIEGYRDEDHLGHAAFNIMAMIHTTEMIRRGILPESLDTLPDYLTGFTDPKNPQDV